ncbi:hypothetical protein IG631_22170 [Alternaria alternata]|nr:hypothetical protein IG631_22170 [Alternaria alternata]
MQQVKRRCGGEVLAAPQHVVLCRDRTTTTTVNKALRLRRGARTLRPDRFHALSEVARETPQNQAGSRPKVGNSTRECACDVGDLQLGVGSMRAGCGTVKTSGVGDGRVYRSWRGKQSAGVWQVWRIGPLLVP